MEPVRRAKIHMLTMCFTQASLVQPHWELSVLKMHVDLNLSWLESHMCSVIYKQNQITCSYNRTLYAREGWPRMQISNQIPVKTLQIQKQSKLNQSPRTVQAEIIKKCPESLLRWDLLTAIPKCEAPQGEKQTKKKTPGYTFALTTHCL